MISYSSLVKKKSISCRFYTEDANSGNAHRAAGMTIELRDTGTYGFELPPSQVYSYIQQVVWAWKFARHDIIIVFLIIDYEYSSTDHSQWRGDSACCPGVCRGVE